MSLHLPSVHDVLSLPVAGAAAFLFRIAFWLNSTPDPKPFITDHESL